VSDLGTLQTHLGYAFRDAGLLRLALTHPSVAHEQGVVVHHNQRLEFLGDAVLQLVLTQVLYDKFPEFGEGPLTKARAQLVNSRALAEHGRRLGLGSHLILSRGEEMNHGRARPSTLADAYEALLGAVFLDGGFEAARQCIEKQYRNVMSELEAIPNLDNPKGELQEVLQAQSPVPPNYQLIAVNGPDHDRIFESAVYYRGEELGRGTGKSKKEAESQAAFQALETLRRRAIEPNPAVDEGKPPPETGEPSAALPQPHQGDQGIRG
jgi:ribonuclease-3